MMISILRECFDRGQMLICLWGQSKDTYPTLPS